ncbi:MAG: bis-aminopropyl spermidine synthase family protein [Candidatus Portnoybacteria bacterium]|nr:bis-aminopropyl spermidine synthase family protein [Candidatus Portnoybacteria bacterium]
MSRGTARNEGVKVASGNVLIFIDDDTIILDEKAFSKIHKLSQEFDYGYGAERLWTNQSLFQRESKVILKNLENGNNDLLKKISSIPETISYRGGATNKNLLAKTFIGNFGFCNRDVFQKSNGFPDFKGYGFEDDYLMFKLFKHDFNLTSLKNITVVHVNHKIKKEQTRNLIDYFLKLIENNYYWFHVEKTFSDKINDKSIILEDLKSLHYDYRIEKSYEDYLKLLPLDLLTSSKIKIDYWKEHYQYSKIDFARLILVLQNSNNIDDFVKNSFADFDNLASIVVVSINNGIVSIDNNGKIKKLFNFSFTLPYSSRVLKQKISIEPNKKLNQFPCDERSRDKRYKLLKNRYPFAEYLRFAIIGDDDLLSLKFINDYWAFPVVIEKDKRIINLIKDIKNHFKIFNIDIRFIEKEKIIPTVQTFITDPPYTLNGALAFIHAGLSMLDNSFEEKEFYVILNPLYDERKRADKFLKTHKIKNDSLVYSSSSNLYIFSVVKPDLVGIKKSIDFNKLYNHYL